MKIHCCLPDLKRELAQAKIALGNSHSAAAGAGAGAAAKPSSPTGLNLAISYVIDYNALTLGKKLGQGSHKFLMFEKMVEFIINI